MTRVHDEGSRDGGSFKTVEVFSEAAEATGPLRFSLMLNGARQCEGGRRVNLSWDVRRAFNFP